MHSHALYYIRRSVIGEPRPNVSMFHVSSLEESHVPKPVIKRPDPDAIRYDRAAIGARHFGISSVVRQRRSLCGDGHSIRMASPSHFFLDSPAIIKKNATANAILCLFDFHSESVKSIFNARRSKIEMQTRPKRSVQRQRIMRKRECA